MQKPLDLVYINLLWEFQPELRTAFIPTITKPKSHHKAAQHGAKRAQNILLPSMGPVLYTKSHQITARLCL